MLMMEGDQRRKGMMREGDEEKEEKGMGGSKEGNNGVIAHTKANDWDKEDVLLLVQQKLNAASGMDEK